MQNRNTAREPARRQPLPPAIPALMFAVSVVGSNGLALSPILADVARSFASTPLTVSTAISAYGAATAASAFLLAARIDRWGIRRSLLIAMAVLIGALLLSAGAPHWIVLTLAQAVAGAAAGVILPAAYGSASLVAAAGQETRALGRVISGWSVSLVAGVPLSALISDAVGWRATYGVLALCAAVALAGLRKLPERRGAHAAPPRLSRLLAPLSYRDVPVLLLGCLAFSSAFYGVYAFLADHVRTLLALSAGQVGFIAFAYGAGFLLAGLAGAPLIERLGPRRALPLALAALSAVYLALLPAAHALAAVLALAVLWGAASQLSLNLLVLLLSRARPEERGAVLGFNTCTTYLGASVGTAVAGTLYTHAGFESLGLVAAAALALAALGLHWRLNGRRTREGRVTA
ncbi:MFS transporter [Achromobacter xylosoxidans]|uniref:MFS transporter n=1 Tax=Alcaligenes xylosoxydans xylosoxydans TaxID=85698 RepID=UPI0006AC4015|nr:MFS transporter [Achromobacter xylosoxidans]KOQ23338.1 MFS transporter [Achromobacter xylosoxidans]KOQ28367.1 MFS transporter [Achromobacter xylosoxidans]KOQ33379.1 MFS transporter [Achromobacter xylosoxidans]KOQ37108.1 MFS transporter [Achromobacter xylosoxidans]KOQ47702.1 MFS transporter [Achromobacter xylosoxidans]